MSQQSAAEATASTPDLAEEFLDRTSTLGRVRGVLHRYPAISPGIVLVLAVIVFGSLNDRFLEPSNLSLVTQQVAVVGTLALAQTLIILTAGIDLSVGAVMVLSSMVIAQTTVNNGLPPVVGLGLGLAVGLASGAANGFLVTRLKLPPFIVTLGSLNVFLALTLLYSGGATVRGRDMPSQLTLTGETFAVGGVNITVGVVMMLVLYVAIALILHGTAWGRHVYAVGDDTEAARLAGIRVGRVLTSVYLASGAILAVAAWIQIGRSNAASPEHRRRPQPRLHHRRRHRRHQPLRRPRRRLGHAARRAHRRRVPQRPVARRAGRALADVRGRRAHHRGRLGRPVDQEGAQVNTDKTPILEAYGLVKTFGRVVGLDGVDLELYPGEVLAVIGDNGAGKSTLIKCLTGAEIPDGGEIRLDGTRMQFKGPQDARAHGIETVYQNLALSPALDIAANLFLGREERKPGPLGTVLRVIDKKGMRRRAREELSALGITTLQDVTVPVENLSGGQRQAVAVARAAAFGSKVVVLDEPTAALGVRESNQVLELIRNLRDRGVPVILISHNMPHVFEVADRIHIQRLGKRAATITPESHTMTDAVAIMTGAREATA